ncbi:MAG: 2-amino-4-hydroxy-6-hydroxymethyldihydropteridine diphosphokinase [Myxococcota bacterium]
MNSAGEIVYVALGANLGDRGATFASAIEAFEQDADLDLLRVSSIFETDPVGPAGQDAYLNAVVEIRVRLGPPELLARLHAIERAMGRDREAEAERWGPRELDLDILFFGDRWIESPTLVVPHARAHERNFVMTPLAEIVPDLIHPKLGLSVAEIARGLPELDRRSVWADPAAWPGRIAAGLDRSPEKTCP